MKAGCLFVSVVLALVAAGLAFLILVGSGAPPHAELMPTPGPSSTPPPAPTPDPTPTPLPDTYQEWVGSLNSFRRSDTRDSFVVTYGFIDHHGLSHEVTCGVRRKDYDRENGSYGYRKADIDSRGAPELQHWTDDLLRSRGLSPYVTITVKGAISGYHWHWELPGTMNEAEQNDRKAEIEAFLKWFQGAYDEQATAVRAALFRERGFRLANHVISIDYPGIVHRGRAPLEDCSRALELSGPAYNRRQQLGLFQAFLQEIRYEIPADVVNGRESLGLYVPTEVVVNDHGDCDSKSVAFAALWLRLGTPVILISVPNHMLVGVEIKPGPREAYVRIRNRYFVLCEVAGPGKSHPGERPLAGSYEYMLLEPKG